MSEPLSISPASREVIENKLLSALEDDNTVAILASKQDLDDLIEALEEFRPVGWTSTRSDQVERCRNLAAGMRQLRYAAFPSQGDKS